MGLCEWLLRGPPKSRNENSAPQRCPAAHLGQGVKYHWNGGDLNTWTALPSSDRAHRSGRAERPHPPLGESVTSFSFRIASRNRVRTLNWMRTNVCEPLFEPEKRSFEPLVGQRCNHNRDDKRRCSDFYAPSERLVAPSRLHQKITNQKP